MHFLDLTLPTLAANLALDEALLLEAESGRGGEVLRFWEWPSFAVVVGAGGRLADDVDEAACAAEGVPTFRRSSGGGSVLLGPGCLLYTLVLSYDRAAELREIPPSYRFILGRIQDALRDVQPGIEVAGVSDLAVRGIKVSGNSQQRKRRFLLHHGTFLYDFPLDRIGRFLHEPARQPKYRERRTHAAFLGNLKAAPALLQERLRTEWAAKALLQEWPREEVARLVSEKYARPDWTRRR